MNGEASGSNFRQIFYLFLFIGHSAKVPSAAESVKTLQGLQSFGNGTVIQFLCIAVAKTSEYWIGCYGTFPTIVPVQTDTSGPF